VKRKFLKRLEQSSVIEDEDGRIEDSRHRTSTAALQGLFLQQGNMEGAIAMAEGLRIHSQAVDHRSTRTGTAA
jgi:hypothetical protein